MVTIATLTNLNDAFLLRSILQAENIPAFIPDENTSLTYLSALGGVRVQVPEEFAEEVRPILESFRNNLKSNSGGEGNQIADFWKNVPVAEVESVKKPIENAVHTGLKPWQGVTFMLIALAAAWVFFTLVDRERKHLDYYLEGSAAYEKGDYHQAITDFTKAISLYPNYAEAYEARGMSFLGLRDYTAAIDDFSRAMVLNPKLEHLFVNRGLAYDDSGEYDKAIVDYTYALQVDPNDQYATYNRGRAYVDKKEFQNAIADFTHSIQINAKDVDAYLNRSYDYRSLGEKEKAMADLNSVIQIDPKNVDSYNTLAWDLATCSQASLRNGKKALELATTANELSDGKDPEVLDTLAAAYAETGDFENAVKWEQKGLELSKPVSKDVEDMKKRLALYQTAKPYREGK